MRILWLVFVITPLLEMYVLLSVGGWIGVLPTIACVVLTATVGLMLLRAEGLAALMRVQERLQQGEAPADELVGGLFLVVGGALLITPGFVTDAIGFVLLVRPTRMLMVRALGRSLVSQLRARSADPQGPVILEGEFERAGSRYPDERGDGPCDGAPPLRGPQG